MTCEDYLALRGKCSPDTPASLMMAAWRHHDSCLACQAIAQKVWEESSQTRRDKIAAIAPLVALSLAIRSANDPEISTEGGQ